MPITIVEFDATMTGEVVRFNQRLAAAGVDVRFPTSPLSPWLPKTDGRKLFEEHFLALDESAAVRGGYVLKHQEFHVGDKIVLLGFYHAPLSEGIVDKAYGNVGLKMLLDALRRQPLLYCLGMGGLDQPLPRMLAGLRWTLTEVPFYFRVVRPFGFLRNIAPLRRSLPKRILCDLLAFSGLGWLGIQAIHAARSRRFRLDRGLEAEAVDEFGPWADALWEAGKREYGMSAVRDGQSLSLLYPRGRQRFLRLRVWRAGQVIGWAVCLNTPMAGDRFFGNMRLGSIVDCFAVPGCAAGVIASATGFLRRQGVDLIVSNQLHAAWGKALADAGCLRGPSNFIFATSKALTGLLESSGVSAGIIHQNRGDGDGPIHL